MTDKPRDGSGGSGKHNYEVGYGKPPKHTQWKKKQSGNRKGRPKGSPNLKTIMERVFSEMTIDVTENGSTHRMNVVEAVLKRLAHEALKGRPSAMVEFLNRAERHLDGPPPSSPELSEQDEQILERALQRKALRAGST